MGKKIRGNGDGSVYRQTSDGRWVAAIYVTDPATGKKKRVKEYFRSKRQAKARLEEIKNEIKDGLLVGGTNYFLLDWINKFMAAYVIANCDINVYYRKMELINCHIATSDIANIPISQLKQIDIQEFYVGLQKTGKKARVKDESGNFKSVSVGGLASQTIVHIHHIINPALRAACDNGLIRKNPAEKLGKLLKIKRTREILTLCVDEVGKYLDQLVTHRLYALSVVELCIGLRRGELLGLWWQDFDVEKHEISINRQVQRIKKEDGSGSYLGYKGLKTPASYRTIKLPLAAYNALLEHKERQEAEKAKAGKGYLDEDLIFCTPIGKKIEPRRIYTIHCKALISAGIQHTAFHNLRHTVSTLLLQHGESTKSLQELLGHADIKTTLNIYAHVLEEMKTATAMKMDSIIQAVLPRNNPGISPDCPPNP